MRKSLVIAAIVALLLWIVYAGIVLGAYRPGWLPETFSTLSRPTSLSDFGQAFSAFEGIVSTFALMLGLLAILVQVRQNSAANTIGALSVRQQFLMADYARLDSQINSYSAKNSGNAFDQNLFNNMVKKRKERLDEAKRVDELLKNLLAGPGSSSDS